MPRIPNPIPRLRCFAKAVSSLGRSAGSFPGRLGIASTTLVGVFVAVAFGLICYLGVQGWPSALGVGVSGDQVLEVDAERPPAGRSSAGSAGPSAATGAGGRTVPAGRPTDAEPGPGGGGGVEGTGPAGDSPNAPDVGEPDGVPVSAPPAGPGGGGQSEPQAAPVSPPASPPKPPTPAGSPGGSDDPGGPKPVKPPNPTNPPPSPKPTKQSTAPKPPQSAKPTKPTK